MNQRIGQVTFYDTLCDVILTKYYNGVPAILLKDSGTGELVATTTVNLDEPPKPGHVFIKNYNENNGILEALIEADIITKPVNYHPAGYTLVPECFLLKTGE